MATLHETVDTSLPIERAFAFIADFSNAARWDPGTVTSEPVADRRPRVGTAYRLGVKMGGRVVPMEYRVTQLVPNSRVVLNGTGSGIDATDDIRFETTTSGTRIDYTAEINLRGWLRLVAPFAGRAFASIGRAAREGMKQALDNLAQQESMESTPADDQANAA